MTPRERLNFWGTVVFAILILISAGNGLYKMFLGETDKTVTEHKPTPTAPEKSAAPIVAKPVPPPQTETAVKTVTETSEAATTCIRQAQHQGYKSGQCAFDFIETCIRTQSRSEMESVLRRDAMLGIGTERSCPNMPTTYQAAFDKF